MRGMKNGSKTKNQEMVRKIAMGMNFAVVGIENQDEIDYSMVLRNMVYDADEYERQAARIRKEVRKNRDGLSRGEYMYGFRKDSTLHPVITFVLYYRGYQCVSNGCEAGV